MLSLVLFSLFVGVSAQCKCNPFYAGDNCTECQDFNLGALTPMDGCEPKTAEDSMMEYYVDQKLPWTDGKVYTTEEFQCYNAGTFDPSGPICECNNPNRDPETYCRTCLAGYINFPSCTVKECEAQTCRGNGECTNGKLRRARCGYDLTEKSMDPDIQQCCSGTKRAAGKDETFYWILDVKDLDLNGKSNGHTCCANQNSGGSGYCEYDEECISNTCVPIGNKQCEYSGEPDPNRVGDLPEQHHCLPYQTCCSTSCCNEDQVCIEQLSGDNARMGWKLPDGTEISPDSPFRMVCSKGFSAPSAIRAGVMPFFLMIAVLVSSALVLMAAGMGEAKVTIPALLVIFCCCLLIISQYWASGLLMALGSLTAIGAQGATSENRHFFSMIVQFLFLAAFVGSFNLGYFFVNGQSAAFAQLQSSGSQNWSVLGTCSAYYDYFSYTPQDKPWDQRADYYDLCSHGWQSFLVFDNILITCLYFVQLVATGTLMISK